jgi:hypothetical protein
VHASAPFEVSRRRLVQQSGARAHFRQHLLPLLEIRRTHPELRVHGEVAAVVDDRQGFFTNAAISILGGLHH